LNFDTIITIHGVIPSKAEVQAERGISHAQSR
jgi:hypothetical protein